MASVPEAVESTTPPCTVKPLTSAWPVPVSLSVPGPVFETTWDTRNTTVGGTGANRIRLPLVADGTYDFVVDWGDGSVSRGTLRLIAREIIVNQSNESGRMVQLLRIFDAAETNETDQVMGWMGEPTPLAQMPGYATDEQMQALQQSRGSEADKLFAELMIAHHEGGLHMAEHIGMHGKNTEVRAMAASMVKAQSGEISEMEKLAAAID